MITFYPGPSKIYPQVADYLQEAFEKGILSQNHRSKPFMDLLHETIDLLHKKLNIPSNYTVIFTSSATECWEIIAQSFVKKHITHFYNGAFGKKWADYSHQLHNTVNRLEFTIESPIEDDWFDDIPTHMECVCITQNETSNGTQVLLDKKNKKPNYLIAVDATSSMAGIELKWQSADIWLASVQKCFGLPAGLGIMVVSPKAVQRAIEINEREHYNSFLFVHENFQQYQTPYTPNVLGIFLLNRVLAQVPGIAEISKKTKARAAVFYRFIEEQTQWKPLVTNPAVRSDTVFAVSGLPEEITDIKLKALQNNITLGNGYGQWKDTSFRVANFPAIDEWEFDKLRKLLST